MRMLAKHDSRDQLDMFTLNQLLPQMQLINPLMLTKIKQSNYPQENVSCKKIVEK
jgi:hypothetical protein